MNGINRQERGADSPLVERITQVRYDRTVDDWTTPDGCWDIVIRRVRGRVEVLQTGLITRPIPLDYEGGDEYVCISFKPGVFMPTAPGSTMLNRGMLRPTINPRAFWLDGETLEIPTFDNAEGMVERLVRGGFIVRDAIVDAILGGDTPRVSSRSVQRRFHYSVGITRKHLELIHRAQKAVELLRQGRRISDTAFDLGFADQAHLTRALKGFMGKTPSSFSPDR
jgi:Helix-turn-helix domain